MNAPLYVRVMGDAWARIAAPVRLAHANYPVTRAHGHLRVEHGRHFAARLLVQLLGLPRQSAAADTRLIVTARPDGESWQRTIDGWRFDTWQYQSNASELGERFGVFDLRFRLDEAAGSLLYVHRESAVVFGSRRLRVPGLCAPRVEAREDPSGPASVKVSVRISLPLVGLLIAYDGTIEIEGSGP